MKTLADLSALLERSGYVRSSDGTYATEDARRAVVLMEAASDSSLWAGQVSAVLAAPAIQQMPAWARYIVLVQTGEATDRLRGAAAAFSRDVTKCRRLFVFLNSTSVPTLPFLPLETTSTPGVMAPDFDVLGTIKKYLEPDLATVFADTEIANAALERHIDREAAR